MRARKISKSLSLHLTCLLAAAMLASCASYEPDTIERDQMD